jgi:glycosyltransferase involved in cell wall biosynthesis
LTQTRGGPVDHVRDLTRELAALGHQVIVVGPLNTIDRSWAHPDVAFASLHTPSTIQGAAQIARLRRIVRELRPEVIHCQDRRAGLLGRVVGRLTATPCVYTLHGAPDELAHLVPNNARIGQERRTSRFKYLAAERGLARWSGSRVIVASSALGTYAAEAVGLPQQTIDVIPNGIRWQEFPSHIPSSGYEVVWLGVMAPVKRVDVLLESVAMIPGPIRLHLVGDGPLRAFMEAQVAALGIQSRVVFAGFENDPRASLNRAHVAVLCSDAENCPLALLQAMASGCAVVATSVGGIPELVTDGKEGMLVPPGSPGALAEALLELRENPTQRTRFAHAASARARLYGARDMAERTVITYARAVAG